MISPNGLAEPTPQNSSTGKRMITIADLEEQADLDEQFEEIQSERGCLPLLEMLILLLKGETNDC